MNTKAIGICVVVNYDLEAPKYGQYWMLACLCRDLMRDFGIPMTNIMPHKDFAPKTCPGKMFSMDRLKQKGLKLR